MPIPIICPCSAKLRVGDHLDGKWIQCPKCGKKMPVGATANGSAGARPKPSPARSAAEVLAESDLSPEERQRLEAELEGGERLLWAGKPVAQRAFLRGWGIGGGFICGAILMIVMMIIISNIMAEQGGGDKGFLTIMRIILITASAACVLGGVAWPYLVRMYARRTTYAVSNKRALVWGCNYFGKVGLVSYDPTDMVKLYREDITKGDDNLGNLIFGSRVVERRTKDGIVRTYRRYGFFIIRRPAAVEKLLREHLLDPFLEAAYEE